MDCSHNLSRGKPSHSVAGWSMEFGISLEEWQGISLRGAQSWQPEMHLPVICILSLNSALQWNYQKTPSFLKSSQVAAQALPMACPCSTRSTAECVFAPREAPLGLPASDQEHNLQHLNTSSRNMELSSRNTVFVPEQVNALTWKWHEYDVTDVNFCG